MTSRYLMAAACCLLTSIPALSQAQASGCGKPFTARAFGAGAGKQGATVACQGPMLRMVMDGAPGMTLIDGRKGGKAYFIYHDTRDYYELPTEKDEGPAFTPCQELADMKKDFPGATCRKVGSETVNGRKTDKWVTKGEEGGDEVVEYFDPELNVPVRVVKGDTVESELKDIKVGAVSGPMSLPASYRKLTQKEFTQRAIEATKKAMGKNG